MTRLSVTSGDSSRRARQTVRRTVGRSRPRRGGWPGGDLWLPGGERGREDDNGSDAGRDDRADDRSGLDQWGRPGRGRECGAFADRAAHRGTGTVRTVVGRREPRLPRPPARSAVAEAARTSPSLPRLARALGATE